MSPSAHTRIWLRLAFAVALFTFAIALNAQALDEPFARASALAADGQVEEARAAYSTALAAHPEDGAAWMAFAQLLHGVNEFDEAISAYLRAAALGHHPQRAYFRAARAAASRADTGHALILLEEVLAAGGTPYVQTLRAAEFAELHDDPKFQAIVERMRPCREPERRQFDFWLGDWDVANPQGTIVGHNVIQSLEGGCWLRENYDAGPYSGTSLNFWDPASGRWHQTWIDNQGQPLYLDGGLVDGRMVLTGASGGATQRITWSPLDDGRVRQLWESSSDDGATWSVAFDGYYSKRP